VKLPRRLPAHSVTAFALSARPTRAEESHPSAVLPVLGLARIVLNDNKLRPQKFPFFAKALQLCVENKIKAMRLHRKNTPL
jgi:hypothetical protein